jgi:CPA2 family monovalent cation:H+ antiporter-2
MCRMMLRVLATLAVLALSVAIVDALSLSKNGRLGGASFSSSHMSTKYVHGPSAIWPTPPTPTTSTRLSMTSTSDAGGSFDDSERIASINSRRGRGIIQSAFSKISQKIRGVNTAVSKREQFKTKFVSLGMAFSALFFISTGRHTDFFSSPSTSSSTSNAAVTSSVMARGGGATTRAFNSILSRAKHYPTTSSDSSILPVDRTIVNQWDELRGGAAKKAASSSNSGFEAVEELSTQTQRTFREAISGLNKYMKGPKSDTLFLLFATALITPLCKMVGTSPILGFLASGMLLGPNGFGVISGIHTTETLAELGIVFFLFEMGIELSVERLKSMKKDVFGLGLSQYTVTAVVLGLAAKVFGGLSGPASVVVGGALSLSSSAFVLQLIKDKKELATRFGKASFGVLLLQDLAVVPLLVATPILAGSGSMASALGSAIVKAAMALSGIAMAGRFALNPLFKTVAAANSQEAFLGVILFTALGMSFLTEGLGLSNTLGAFLAGVLLSETKYRYQVEADIAPFRGILLGLFFVTVGFEIDIHLIANNLPIVSAIVAGILGLKAGILTLLCKMFGLSDSTSTRTGLILSQGGEFAFVAFALARSLGILDKATTKMLLTCVSLTMALTPLLDEVGSNIAQKLEEGSNFTHYMGQDDDALEITESDADTGFVVVVGYGVVGKVVCDLLDKKFVKYVGMEKDPAKAIQARNKGLPVFFGDVGRQEVAEAFNIGKAKAVIVTISDKAEATRAVIALRRLYPDKPIFARAKDADHAKRLQSTLDVAAMVPIFPEDNLLLTLPFGGAVLRSLGFPAEEVNYILAEKRREVLSGKELERFEEESVMAQLGVEKDDDEVDDGADGNDAGIETESKSDITTSDKPAKEAKQRDTMKALVKQVVEANTSPGQKKRDIEADSEDESEVITALDQELREKEVEKL